MRATDALPVGSWIFLDTAPIVYFLESISPYHAPLRGIFQRIDSGAINAVTSPVTLAECLVKPMRQENAVLQRMFIDTVTAGRSTTFVDIDAAIAANAATIRARYNLSLLDAIQIAVAQHADCDVFLTNDIRLQRITEIRVLLVSDFE